MVRHIDPLTNEAVFLTSYYVSLINKSTNTYGNCCKTVSSVYNLGERGDRGANKVGGAKWKLSNIYVSFDEILALE